MPCSIHVRMFYRTAVFATSTDEIDIQTQRKQITLLYFFCVRTMRKIYADFHVFFPFCSFICKLQCSHVNDVVLFRWVTGLQAGSCIIFQATCSICIIASHDRIDELLSPVH